jgi:hypothetical protein
MFSLILIAALSQTILASPASTVWDNEVHYTTGWTARPTPPPNFELLRRNAMEDGEVAKRAITSGELIGYLGPDNTCGYISGQLGMFYWALTTWINPDSFIFWCSRTILLRTCRLGLLFCFPLSPSVRSTDLNRH